MIPSVLFSTVSFGANSKNPVRASYNNHLNTVNQTAQAQKNVMPENKQGQNTPSLTNPIPMQGTGQKLDVQA